MPKLKTHKATAKRVSVTKTGKLRHKHTNSNHFLQKKSGSRKRTFAGLQELKGKQVKNIKRKLGI